MDITKIKHWSNIVQNETIDHVLINYKEGDKIVNYHQFGENAVAAPEFYSDFENMSEMVCKVTGLPKKLSSAISVREVTIAKSEDKDGNDNTKYTITSGFKSGHASTTITTSVQHKYIPEGFDEAIQNLINETEEYIGGKRQQTDLFESKEEDESETEEDTGEDE